MRGSARATMGINYLADVFFSWLGLFLAGSMAFR